MTPEEEAKQLIVTLQYIIEDLQTIANGKNYTSEQAREELGGILMELEVEGKGGRST